MDSIRYNPYRIAGILSNATQRELQKQKARIKAFAKVGKEIKSDFDFKLLGSLTRTETSIAKAFTKLEQNQDKVHHALFWFLNACPFDHTAIEYLKTGNHEKAVEIWEKVTRQNEVTVKNFSAFNNLGTVKLLSQNQEDIKAGIEAKIKLIESDYFWDFADCIADETYTVDNKKQTEEFVDDLLSNFNGEFSIAETIDLFSSCNGVTQKHLSRKFTVEPISRIENFIEVTKSKRKADKKQAYEYGLRLFEKSKDDLAKLKNIIGTGDLKYKMVADNLAKEIMQCGIDYFNENDKSAQSGNYLDLAQNLVNLSKTIAIDKLTKDKIKDTLNAFDEMKDREINAALEVLQSFENTFRSNAQKIADQVYSSPLNANTYIDTNKFKKVVQGSIDWNKVVDIVIEVIPKSNISKIKQVSDPRKLEKYKSLVDFLFQNLNRVQNNKVKYLAFWITEDAISNLKFTIKSLPVWVKWISVILIIFVLSWLIWGEDGIIGVFYIAFMLGLGFLVDKMRY